MNYYNKKILNLIQIAFRLRSVEFTQTSWWGRKKKPNKTSCYILDEVYLSNPTEPDGVGCLLLPV